MTNTQANQQIAQEIYRQLGGNRFAVMTGSKNFAYDGAALQMHLARNKSTAKYLKITLEANDTYTMVFSKLTKNYELVVVAEFEDLYADMLQDVFTSFTGLYTSL
jgi:hypothetical protein